MSGIPSPYPYLTPSENVFVSKKIVAEALSLSRSDISSVENCFGRDIRDFVVCSKQGEYITVSKSSKFENIIYSFGAHIDGSSGKLHKNNSLSEILDKLLDTTSIVVHEPSCTRVRGCLGWSTWTGTSPSREANRFVTTTGLSIDSDLFSGHDNDTINVTAVPKYPGELVYLWKHNGLPFFSTSTKLDARLVRKEGSPFLPELYASLGGPTIPELFPDESSSDGEGVAYVFLISHPSVIKKSKVNVGEGRVIFIGTVFSKLSPGAFMTPPASGIKNLGERLVPNAEIRNTVTWPDTYVEKTNDGVRYLAVATICVPGVDFVDDDYDLYSDTPVEGTWVDNYPYFPPSTRSKPLPPKGGALDSTYKAFTRQSDFSNVPEVGAPPSSLTASGVTDVLRNGFGFRVKENGAPCGESVIFRIHNKRTGVCRFVTIQPQTVAVRKELLGKSTPVKVRLSELFNLVKFCSEYEKSKSFASGSEAFNPDLGLFFSGVSWPGASPPGLPEPHVKGSIAKFVETNSEFKTINDNIKFSLDAIDEMIVHNKKNRTGSKLPASVRYPFVPTCGCKHFTVCSHLTEDKMTCFMDSRKKMDLFREMFPSVSLRNVEKACSMVENAYVTVLPDVVKDAEYVKTTSHLVGHTKLSEMFFKSCKVSRSAFETSTILDLKHSREDARRPQILRDHQNRVY